MKRVLLALLAIVMMSGTVVLSQDQDRDRLQKQLRIHQEDHLYLKDGKLYQVKAGVQTQLQEQFKLKNGTVVNPDGSYQLQNRERYQLRDGECMDMDGNRYRNQNMYNRRVRMTDKQLERERTRSNNQNQNRQGNRSGGGYRGGQQ